MPETFKPDVNAEPSPALADAIASSPEAQEQIEQQVQDTQTPTAEQGESQEQTEQQETEENVPFHKHPRFKEIIEENRWMRQQLERSLQNQQPQQQPQQPETNPYAGYTPEEERFWRAVDQRAERIADQKLKQINPVIDAGRQELAVMKVQQFRSLHPDVKPESPEETAIAQRISAGYLPEDAYRAVMWDRKVSEAEKKANINVKQRIEAKKQANTETRSIPSSAVAPTNQKIPLRDRIAQNYEKMERGEI